MDTTAETEVEDPFFIDTAAPNPIATSAPVASMEIVFLDYTHISLNKMFLFTGELMPLINFYINGDISIDIIKPFLDKIYSERRSTNIEVTEDWKTVDQVPLGDKYREINEQITNPAERNALYCLAYAEMIDNASNNVPTLFLNPFFFPFHRAFILSDGIHDLEPRQNMTAKFWSKLFNTKNYRNKEDLREAIFNTAIEPPKESSDEIAKKYIDKWTDLNAGGGFKLIEPINGNDRLVANVIIPSVDDYEELDKFNTVTSNNSKIYRVGDSSKLQKYQETKEEKTARKKREAERKKLKKKKLSDEDEDEADDEGGSAFNAAFSNKIKEIYGFNGDGKFAVSDCAGPNSQQYSQILEDSSPNSEKVTSIVSGTLDSSSASNIGLRAHLTQLLNNLLGYASPVCILLPEASILQGDNGPVKEVMQRINIGEIDAATGNRTFQMLFESWSAETKLHCPLQGQGQRDEVIIEDNDKCPGVNETIQYIFSKLGVKDSSLLKAGACCLFGFSGGGEKLNADAETYDFLEKYYDAFERIGIDPESMNEMGGCLFRVKTMGDFYRLADTALIQYILGDKGKALLGTCDEFNAINSYASNNLWTIYGTPIHRFQSYGPPSDAMPIDLESIETEKRRKKFVKLIKEVVRIQERISELKEKLERGNSKLNTTIKSLNDVKPNLIDIIRTIVGETNNSNQFIKRAVIDEMDFARQIGESRNASKYVKILEDNKGIFSSVIDSLKINAKNRIFVLLTIKFLQEILLVIEAKIKSYIPAKIETDIIDNIIKSDLDNSISAFFDSINEEEGKEEEIYTLSDGFIKTYSNIVKLLDQINYDTNEIKTLPEKLFENTPTMINYDNYIKAGVCKDSLYKNPVTFSKNKKTPFDELCNKLFTIFEIDNTNFLSLLETAFSFKLNLNDPTNIGTFHDLNAALPKVSELYIPVVPEHDDVILTNIQSFIANAPVSAPVSAPAPVSMAVPVPIAPSGVEPMSGGNGNIYAEIDNSIRKINARIDCIRLVTADSKIQDILLKKLTSDADLNIFYKNKPFIARYYINIIELLEYLMETESDQAYKERISEIYNKLNEYFERVNLHAIDKRFKIQYTNFISGIKHHVGVEKQKSLQVLNQHLYDLFIDFMQNGIFIKNYNLTDGSSTTQMYFNKESTQIKLFIIPNNDEAVEKVIEGNNKSIFGLKELSVDLNDIPSDILNQIKSDYSDFTFLDENPMTNLFLFVIYLNKYNVDDYYRGRLDIYKNESYAAAASRTIKASKKHNTVRDRQLREISNLLKITVRKLKSLSENKVNQLLLGKKGKKFKSLMFHKKTQGRANKPIGAMQGKTQKKSVFVTDDEGIKRRKLRHSVGGTRKYINERDIKTTRRLNKRINNKLTKQKKCRVKKYTRKHYHK